MGEFMKNVVIISSSPRNDGNSETLARQFEAGAKTTGHNVDFIILRDYNLGYCKACYLCEKTGKCFQNDGMNEINEKLVNADVIVFATPVYFYSMSGQLKVMIDRLVPSYTKINADIYIIATQWDSDIKIMENTINSIRGCTKECFENCEEKGILYGVSLSEKGEAKANIEYMNKAFEMGKSC